jgi:hypothetical protein
MMILSECAMLQVKTQSLLTLAGRFGRVADKVQIGREVRCRREADTADRAVYVANRLQRSGHERN